MEIGLKSIFKLSSYALKTSLSFFVSGDYHFFQECLCCFITSVFAFLDCSVEKAGHGVLIINEIHKVGVLLPVCLWWSSLIQKRAYENNPLMSERRRMVGSTYGMWEVRAQICFWLVVEHLDMHATPCQLGLWESLWMPLDGGLLFHIKKNTQLFGAGTGTWLSQMLVWCS